MSESQVISWINSLTNANISSIETGLKDGVVLCNLVNAIRPNTILTINKYNAAFRQMQNIDNFLKVVEKLGVADEDRFKTEDLFYGNNIPKVVLTLALFAQVCAEKYGTSNSVSGSVSDLRSNAQSAQKEGGKKREVDTGLSIFETGMKKAQLEASNVNRTNDRMIHKDMQDYAATGELGFVETDMVKKQIMIENAKRSGQDLIIRSKETAVVSSELAFAEADRQSKQAMISDAKGRHMDQIVRTKDQAVVSGELGFAEADRQSKQSMISDAHGRHMDQIVRTKDQAVVSGELGFAEADRQSKQSMISDAHGRHMDQIVRTKDTGSSEVNFLETNASEHQKVISDARSEKLDKILKQGDVSEDISYDD